MTLPERFTTLPVYAFPRLRALLDSHPAGGPVRHMTIGEPRHAFPAWISDVITENLAEFGKYPPNESTPELRAAISDWVGRRYGVSIDPETDVVGVNGTREALYNAGMTLCPETKNGKQPVVLLPNPFYQVYIVSALSVGAEPVLVPATAETGHLPDYASLPTEVLDRTTLCYICSPANPQGAVADEAYWRALIALAEKHDFKILADECYSEIYRDTPPVGALAVARDMGADPERVVIFQSLSKRSNLPGLRSGFVAGGPKSMARMRQLRAYAGAPVPLPLQRVSERLWADEAHVVENRALYQEKYAIADQIFDGVPGYAAPEAGFFLWLPVEDGEEAALRLWTETGLRVMPGAYFARDGETGNPGKTYLRVAMVAPAEETRDALSLLHKTLYA